MQACRSGLKSRHVASERSRRLLSVVAWCEPSEISSFLLLSLVLHTMQHCHSLSRALAFSSSVVSVVDILLILLA